MQNTSRAIAFACLLAALAWGCDKEAPPTSQGPGGSISGRERIGWNQEAPDAAELAQYSFVLYVDGSPTVLPGVECGALSGETPTAACTAHLPTLQPGTRTLELATRIIRDGAIVESTRSAPLVVTAASTAALSSASEGARSGAPDGSVDQRYFIEPVVTGLRGACDLALLPDGRLLVAEQGGAIWILDGVGLPAEPAVVLAARDARPIDGVSLAVAPDFAATRFVYVAYAQRGGAAERTGVVVRFREVGGMLGEAAVMLEGLPADAGPLRLGIGPDGTLYVGTAALDPGVADDLGSYAGKILRFAPPGVTPPGNPIRSAPVLAFGHRGLVGLAWEPDTGSLWYVESNPSGSSVGRAGAGRREPGVTFLEGVQVADMTFHSADSPAGWRGSLFLASPDHECFYRVSRLAASPPKPAVERLLTGSFGRIAAVLSGPDCLYFATSNSGEGAGVAAADAVFRVRDRGAPR